MKKSEDWVVEMWADHSDAELIDLLDTYKIELEANLVDGVLENRAEVEVVLTDFEMQYLAGGKF